MAKPLKNCSLAIILTLLCPDRYLKKIIRMHHLADTMLGEMEMVGTLGSGKEALAPCLSLARIAGHASAMSD